MNIVGTTWVTKAVLPGMLNRKKGAIVIIRSGSSGAVSSFPLVTIYASTKAFIAMLSRSMSLENRQHGIDIQCQIPLRVVTNMLKSTTRSSFSFPLPETYSKSSLRVIGYEQISVPYWPHSLQWCLLQAVPDAVLDWYHFRHNSGMRKPGLEMLQKKNKP